MQTESVFNRPSRTDSGSAPTHASAFRLERIGSFAESQLSEGEEVVRQTHGEVFEKNGCRQLF